jgi:hypothetical protein
MGYIVFVTDKHKGPQVEMTMEEVRNFPIFSFEGEIPEALIEKANRHHETLGSIIRIEPSDEMVIEEQNKLKAIISNQQKHIMRLERLLHEKGVSDGEISAISKGSNG